MYFHLKYSMIKIYFNYIMTDYARSNLARTLLKNNLVIFDKEKRQYIFNPTFAKEVKA